MKKQTTIAFNKKIYLLGTDAEGTKYWLEAPSWYCGLFWGFGYINAYTNNDYPSRARDLKSHYHFDDLFLNNSKVSAFDAFKEFFNETTLNKKEIGLFIYYMDFSYTLKRDAAALRAGHFNIIKKANFSKAQSIEIAKEINEKMLPAIFKQIDILLSDTDEQQIGGGTN